ncbi:MAG: hypothetical protein ACETWM_03400 [Candidatus Lokiarchaeia archaeon]
MSQFQTLSKQALDFLKELEKENSAIEFSTLTYADGRILATTLTENMDKDVIACSETATFFIGSNLVNHLARGEIDRVLISGNNGVILIQGIGRRSVLTTTVKKGASIKKVMKGVKKHLEKFESIEDSFEAILAQYYLPQDEIISTPKTEKTSIPG